jgi:predicted NodU family carbamoyl transferase
MKILGVSLGHDASLALVIDGVLITAISAERIKKIKHFGYNNLYDWKKDFKEIFKTDCSEIDEIAIVIDTWKHNLILTWNGETKDLISAQVVK